MNLNEMLEKIKFYDELIIPELYPRVVEWLRIHKTTPLGGCYRFVWNKKKRLGVFVPTEEIDKYGDKEMEWYNVATIPARELEPKILDALVKDYDDNVLAECNKIELSRLKKEVDKVTKKYERFKLKVEKDENNRS